MSTRSGSARAEASHAWFTTTRWSVILAAGGSRSGEARAAWEELGLTYWYPLYAFARRQGCLRHDAEDAVQGFFAECLEKGRLAGADPKRGRFRTFLLVAFKRHLGHRREKETTWKRGGGRVLSLDAAEAEQRYALEPVDRLSADLLYDRRWALTLLEQVLTKLRADEEKAGRGAVYGTLKEALTSRGGESGLAELGRRLGLSEGAVKVAVHRLRRRYRALLEQEIADTVADPAQIEEERRHLLAALVL